MKKVLLIVAIIIIIVIGVVYFYDSERGKMMIGEELGDPYIIGNIYDIFYTAEGGSVMIAEGFDEDDEMGIGYTGKAISLAINEDTKIMNSDGRFISGADLKVGDKVRAWTIGAILESYPEQGTAFVIMLEEVEEVVVGGGDLIEDDTDIVVDDDNDIDNNIDIDDSGVVCYAGGCSGELCTDQEDAISTCELLSGMECIAKGMSCEAVDGECAWVMSREAAECLMAVEEEEGSGVRDTRIGYLFEKAERFLE